MVDCGIIPAMRFKLLSAVALLCSAAILAGAQSPATSSASPISPETREAVRQLIGDSILNGKAYEYDGYLADMIGPRLTGSANFMRAAQWAEQQFQALGLANVHTEEWTIAATWEPDGPAVGHIVSPVDHVLHLYSVGWSPSTPAGGMTGNVAYIQSLAPEALDAQKAQISGAIALIDRGSYGPRITVEGLLTGYEHLMSLSPAAIVTTGIANGAESQGALSFTGKISAVPAAQVGLEDSLLIKRLLARGPVSMQFSFTNRIRSDVKIPNVIAEIPGNQRPDQVVLVGAHLDSWHPGTGAQDNGTGAASVLEAARAIKALNRPPQRTIRFVLFGGEEEGLLGSSAYVRQHTDDLAKIDAVLITDSGAEPAKGWFLMGREDERNAVAGLGPLLAGLGADGISSDTGTIFQTDHAAFDMVGVPTLVLWTGEEKYATLHHKASDTFDSVVDKDLTQGATAVSVTAYAIADNREELAPHLSPDEVRAMLEKFGDWDGYTYLKKAGVLP
jgi:carboxypeptidase Q